MANRGYCISVARHYAHSPWYVQNILSLFEYSYLCIVLVLRTIPDWTFSVPMGHKPHGRTSCDNRNSYILHLVCADELLALDGHVLPVYYSGFKSNHMGQNVPHFLELNSIR